MLELLLAIAALAIAVDRVYAPAALFAALFATAWPWRAAWRAARGTALRPALLWGAVALALASIAQPAALAEPIALGRPWTGCIVYLSVIAMMAALLSVLNARSPGGSVWALLMVTLVVLFSIPWLETPGRIRHGRGVYPPYLASPWTLFYAMLVLIGVTNYLPTRFGPAALALGAGFVLEYLSLTRVDWSAETQAALWLLVPWSFTLAVTLASARAGAPSPARGRFERIWFWFRDGWGVVWALRNLERFNRSAELARWPVRLSWFGLVSADAGELDRSAEEPTHAEPTFRALIRRFAEPWRLDQVAGSDAASSCGPVDARP